MKNILLIVDPQNDFITGSLKVEGSEEKMTKLSEYIKEKGYKYDCIFMTKDTHPENHCSFIENGGIWPKHCIVESEGWKMYSKLSEVLLEYDEITEVIYKGDDENKEEYSIFDNELYGGFLKEHIIKFVEDDSDTFVDVCGIAGDYCVLETIKGLTNYINNDHIFILNDFTASIDGGEKLLNYAEENDINIIYDSSLNLEEYVRN